MSSFTFNMSSSLYKVIHDARQAPSTNVEQELQSLRVQLQSARLQSQQYHQELEKLKGGSTSTGSAATDTESAALKEQIKNLEYQLESNKSRHRLELENLQSEVESCKRLRQSESSAATIELSSVQNLLALSQQEVQRVSALWKEALENVRSVQANASSNESDAGSHHVALQAQLSVSQNEAAELRSTVSVRSAQIEKLTQEVEWLRSELSQVQRGAPVVPDASVQLKAEFKSVDEKLQKLQSSVDDSMNRQSDDASNVSRALAAQTESIQRFVTENIAELHREHAKSAELQSELARTKTELENCKSLIESNAADRLTWKADQEKLQNLSIELQSVKTSAEFLQKSLNETSAAKEALSAEHSKALVELGAVRAELQHVQHASDASSIDFASMKVDHDKLIALQVELASTKSTLESTKKAVDECASDRAELKAEQQKCVELRLEIASLTAALEATKSRAEDAAAALIVAEERLNVAQSAGVNNKSTEADLVAANVRLEMLNNTVQTLTAAQATLTEEKAALGSQLSLARKEIELKDGNELKLASEVESLRSKTMQLHAELSQKQKQLDAEAEVSLSVNEKMAAKQRVFEDIARKHDEFVQTLRSDISQLQSENESLREQLADQQGSDDRNFVLLTDLATPDAAEDEYHQVGPMSPGASAAFTELLTPSKSLHFDHFGGTPGKQAVEDVDASTLNLPPPPSSFLATPLARPQPASVPEQGSSGFFTGLLADLKKVASPAPVKSPAKAERSGESDNKNFFSSLFRIDKE